MAIFGNTVVLADPSNENEQIVRQALSTFDNDYKSTWAYTRTASKDDKPVTVGYYDPRQPEAGRWTLITIGGRAPTIKEQKTWSLRRSQEDKSDNSDIGKIVTPGSVQLLEETSTHWLFSFVPASDEYEDKKTRRFISQAAGKLRVNKAGRYVEEVYLFNDKPFRPAFGVKINQFEMRRIYGPNSDGGPVVLLSVDTNIQGRAYLAVSIDDVKKVRFSDYLKVVPADN